MNFDRFGNLTPHEGIEVSLEDLSAFAFNEHRQSLLENFLSWHQRFRSAITPQFTQWIDGSFVTQKNHPNDIDFVTFVDHKLYYAKERFFDPYWSFSLEREGLDSYFVPTFQANHQGYEEYVSDQNYWTKKFGLTREDENGFSLPKGFLIITSK